MSAVRGRSQKYCLLLVAMGLSLDLAIIFKRRQFLLSLVNLDDEELLETYNLTRAELE